MEDLVSSSKAQSPTGPPPEPPTTLRDSPATLITNVKDFVQEYMSHYDASHDYAHILRVLALAQHILKVEQLSNPSTFYDPTIVSLAALLHDVGDRKYDVPTNVADPAMDPEMLVKATLVDLGSSLEQARYVQTIVKNVSYSNEVRNPDRIRGMLLQHPELAIVQDADRLDALGAVGVGRAFTFGGAKGRPMDFHKGAKNGGGKSGMESTVEHFGEKLERLEGMMKTKEGKRLARERTERLKIFKGWWEEENKILRGMQ